MKKYLVIFVSFSINCSQSQSIDNAALIGYRSIKASDFKTHLNILTSDSLEGRETGCPGQKKAAAYISSFFKKLNLEAVGKNGLYTQSFDVEVSKVNPETRIVVKTGNSEQTYRWARDFITDGITDTIVSGPAAFVGFTDTDLDSADAARLKGRIVFTLIGRRNYSDDTSKAATLRRLFAIRRDPGAVAYLMIPDSEGPASYDAAMELIRKINPEKGRMKIKNKPGRDQFPYIRFLVSIKMAGEILGRSGKSLARIKKETLDENGFSPIFLDDVTITIESKIERQIKSTENIAGLLRGSDPVLRNQVVAITAHYDHLGKNSDGTFYPGADDDGSGTSTVLELAEAFTKNPARTRRSLLFLTFTGEEKGLLGSGYYTANPCIPLGLTFADLNIDMVGRLDDSHAADADTNYIYVIGSDKISTELDSLLNAANRESVNLKLDYHYNSDYDPEQLYRRSDHFNFARNGVPVVFFFDGIHPDYHKPTDTADKILYGRMEKVARLIYWLGWKIADLPRPLSISPAEQ